ncbi:unnamed protein product [Allacma fusca]|uniref:Phosphoenolpyruvate synthase n=1 Tax=Allacma fusca TaxID=39272 RepID=A0A8J2K251_9HEXA|nr:unnamed protein product [Allacma fusca]
MLLSIIGFLLTSLLTGSYLVYKITGDLYPRTLKKFLYRLALKNWRSNVAQSLDFYNITNPKSTEDLGIFPCKQEKELESPRIVLKTDQGDDLLFYGVDDDGNVLLMRITRFYGNLAEGNIFLRINGKDYTATCLGHSAANEFAVGTLKLEHVEAMRCWRLWFNGSLRDESGETLFVHATINALWKPLYGPVDLQKNANIQLLSEQLAAGGRFGDALFDLRSLLPVGYRQFGTLNGVVKIDGVETKKPVYLFGHRIRREVTLPAQDTAPGSSVELFGMCGSNGNAFSLSSNQDAWTNAESCHVSGQIIPIVKVEETAESFNNNRSLPNLFTFQVLKGETQSHRVEFWPNLVAKRIGSLEIVPLTLTINTEQSRGILIRNLNSVSSAVVERLGKLSPAPESTHWEHDFVDLESSECLNVSLVGGKGASLAALAKRISRSDESKTGRFETAPGFCVTTHFFRRILDLDKLENIFSQAQTTVELDTACYEAQNIILKTGVEDKIEPLVAVWMNKSFVECEGGKFSRLKADKFAVRSSGTLEDGADLSCAGQNETFLGVKEENVAKKIVECWASLFTSQSVRYRLNHGQPALSDMGVVVQAMVNATAAGVIFSADPITGNPFDILINANYGLGESVVSAACDPDTIRVSRSRNGSNAVTIGSKIVGKKESKIVLIENATGSTSEVLVSEEEAQTCCISDSIALKLASIAIQLVESNDEKPLDIEWALEGEQIYILQSRNITSLDAWTDFEIIHEFDTSLRTQFEVLSTANVGEVMPGAVSPLSMSVMTKALDVSIQRRIQARYDQPAVTSCFRSLAISRQRLFLNIIQTMYRHNDADIQPAMACVDLAVCGHTVINEELHGYAIQRWGVDSPINKIVGLLHSIKTILTSKGQVKEATKQFATYRLNIDSVRNDSAALFHLITDKLLDLERICGIHCTMSEASTASQILTFVILSEGKKLEEWEPSLYNDVSKISAVCSDVESADIPTAMDTLARKIVQEGDEVIKQVTEALDADSLEYIRGNEALRRAYDEFMDKHGHRGIFELDLMRQSWGTNPLSFIKLLKSIVASKSMFKDGWKSTAKVQYPTTEALLDSLDTPIKSSTRKILKIVLPYCRGSVWNREKTKSLLVWVGKEFKLAYNALGEQLARDQLISNPSSVYYFRHQELSEIIARSPSSPRILYKAMRREKLHSQLQNEKYSEFSKGIPEPIDDSIPVALGDQIKATPVSSGKIQGIAKVCFNVEEASSLIKPGDILITLGTDIGWSPFFPMLGGVVTELGGLISHGAVVAREYGLPCIVGATHATKIFKTGETVLLNANEGTLSKVKIEKENVSS